MYLLSGEQYTIKVDSGAFFNLSQDEEVKERVAFYLSGIALATSVERAFGTQRYMVRVQPVKRTLAITVNEKIRKAFEDLGFKNAEIMSIEGGTTSTSVVQDAAQEVGLPAVAAAAGKTIKGLAVVIVGALLLYLIITKGGKQQ
jgi:hypothetical protein